MHAVQPDSIGAMVAETEIGVAPDLPETATLVYGADSLDAAVRWNPIDPADYAAAGTFTVQGFVEGYAAGTVTATVTVRGADPWRVNLAPAGRPAADSTAEGASTDALNDGHVVYSGAAHPAWVSTATGDTHRAGYTWDETVRVDAVTAHFWTGGGAAVPGAWKVQALAGGEWTDVTGAGDYATAEASPNTVSFDAVLATGIRVVLTPGAAAVGLGELEVFGETLDSTAPEVVLTTTGVAGANDWFVSPVTARATASDDRDLRTRIDVAVADAPWQTSENVRYAEVTVSADGEHTVRARATDTAGNTSPEVSMTLRIDTTAPTVSGTLDVAARAVSATASDEGSGVASIEYAVGAPLGWAAYSAPVRVGDERQIVYLRAKDAAGNVSSLGTVTVPLSPDAPLAGNIAPIATATASYTSAWNSVAAVNDGALTGASWGTWPNVGEQWVQLEWDRIVTVDRAGVLFFRDSTDASGAGMIPPRDWKLQYVDLATGQWRDVEAGGAYGRSSTAINDVAFAPVTTTKLRAVMQAWGAASAGGSSGILEFEAWAAVPDPAPSIDVDVTLTSRCVAGKVVLAAVAANDGDASVTIALRTPYGAKTVTNVAPGKRTSHAFTTRLGTTPDGEATATVTSLVGGETITREYTVPYGGHTC